jgi:ligand-binding sensor domain-containing protein
MSATTNGAQPNDFSEMSGMHEHQWVSDLLRYVAEADGGRIRIAATLAAADLRRIWHWTEHHATARDRRTHHIVRHELKRRGLLDPTGVPAPRPAPDAI